MVSSREILQKQKSETIATEVRTYNTIAIDDKHIDNIIKENNDVICQDFNAWYCKCIKLIGSDKFIQLASIARQDGKNKARYFSWLLRREVN